jgi:hypothetical protein
MWRTKLLLLFILYAHLVHAQAQHSDTVDASINRRGLRIATVSAGVVYGGMIVGLNELWYKDSGRQPFAFFDDTREWKQIDKLGHFYSGFYLSFGASKGLQHFNVPRRKADLIGAIAGFGMLVPIEVLDGFSEAYGASVGDVVADGAGALFFLGQQRLWSEVRLVPKFSFHTTRYSKLRPELLGEGASRMLKDYNGQTYWLSADVDKFFTFPKWLNVAVGYGAEGMIYARDEQHAANGYLAPRRQFYLSLDPDLSSIRTRSRLVKTLLFVASMVKIPSPTLEFSGKAARAHLLFF